MITLALIDLSGTIHIGDQLIEGAVDACQRLERHGVTVKFITNTTKISSITLIKQLESFGFVNPQIFTSTASARELLIRNNQRAFALVEPDLREHDLYKNNITTLDPDEANCVLVGLAPSQLNYSQLNQAFRVLMRCKQLTSVSSVSPLIAIHKGKYLRDIDGGLSLGPGGFVSCLEEATGLKAQIVGKPHVAFFAMAMGNTPPEQVVMIGDDVQQDINGASAAGISMTMLVQTGKYKPGDENCATLNTHLVPSIVEAVSVIISQNDAF